MCSYREGIRDAFRDIIGRTKRRAVFRDIDRKFWFLRRGGEIALLERSPLLDEVIEAVLHHQVMSLEYTRFSGAAQHLRLDRRPSCLGERELEDRGEIRRFLRLPRGLASPGARRTASGVRGRAAMKWSRQR